MTRSAAACVKRYLELIARQPKRGTSPEPIRTQLEAVEERIETTESVLIRLQLRQKAIDLQTSLDDFEAMHGDFEQIEADFIENVAVWAEKKGVSYEALRAAGVPAHVLRRAGMS
jgi:hypothetical protein